MKEIISLFCWLFWYSPLAAAFADVVAGTFKGFTVDEACAVTKISGKWSRCNYFLSFFIEAVALEYFIKHTNFNKMDQHNSRRYLITVAAIALKPTFPVYVDLGTWHIIIFVYTLIASVAPVWALLQPRDYLNSYPLILMIVGMGGVFESQSGM